MKRILTFTLSLMTLYCTALADVTLDRQACTNEAESLYTHDEIEAEASDNGFCSGNETIMFIAVTDASGITQSVSLLSILDRTPTVKVVWNGNLPGVIEVKVQYRRFIQGFFMCSISGLRDMYTYRITRGDPSPGGELSDPGILTSTGNTPTYIELTYSKHPEYTHIIPPIKFKVNGEFQSYVTGSSSNNFLIAYNAEAMGDFTFTTEIQNVCGNWNAGPSRIVSVKPTCYNDVPSSNGIVLSGQNLEPPFSDGSYKVNPNQSYSLTPPAEIEDFSSHYNWNVEDGGADITFSGNTFTVLKDLGSYRIIAVAKPGRDDCPVLDPLQLVLGKNNVVVDKVCPLVLPDDLPDFGYNINPGDFVLQHFILTAKSKYSITVMPGITLDLGAELVLETPDPEPAEELDLNFIESLAYDEYGRVISNVRKYFDDRGLAQQTQYKNLSSEVVMATATLYDAFGRPVISTLSAPVSASTETISECDISQDQKIKFSFKPDFVKAGASTNYNYTHFDLYKSNPTTTVNNEINPTPVFGETEGTLGWYYSTTKGNSENPRMNEPLVAATQYPYSRTLFHRDGSGEAKGATKPGDIFKAGGSYIATTINESVAVTDEYLDKYLDIRETELGFGRGTIEGEFFRSVLIDGSEKKSISYTDKSGKGIISLYFGTQTTPISKSYQFYDYAGRLKVSVSPNGVEQYERTTNPVAFNDIDKTTYFYNHKGWLVAVEETDVEKLVTDTDGLGNQLRGRTEYVYRKDGKIRFSQNVKQRRAPVRYSYTNYDRSGRPVESGEYVLGTGAIAFKSTQMTAILENLSADGGLSESNGTKNNRQKTFYDEPDQLLTARTQRFVHGAVSRTQRDNDVTTWYSYDERGRVEWTVQQITGLGAKTIDYRYGPTGQVQEVLYQKGNAQDQFTHFYEYDADGRLFKAYTTTQQLQYDKKGEVENAGVLALQATYHYYLHGPLKRVELAGDLQGIDYVYTAEGALKSINSADPASDPGDDGEGETPEFRKDVFGMTLDYYSNDYNSANNPLTTVTIPVEYPEQRTGLIRAMRWHSPIEDHKQVGYGYTYDERNQFNQAAWGSVNLGAFTNNALSAYKEVVSGYDLNGNIDELTRKNSIGSNIANFDYLYIPNTNKLDKILDKDNNNAVIRDYEYNEIGELKSEAGDAEKHIEYDVTGKVTRVYRDAAKTKLATAFVYDDGGFRLNKTSYNKDGDDTLRTWYVRNASGSVMATYEHDLKESDPIKITELPVYASGRIGIFKPQFNYTQYELTDHLGNVRAVIGQPFEFEYLATMESERLSKESSAQLGEFDNVDNDATATDFNHTPSSITVNGLTETIANPNEVNRLNTMPVSGEPTSAVGTGIMLWVHPGDVIDAEVYAKYANFNSSDENIVEGMAAYLTSVFGASPIVDGPPVFNVVDEPWFATLPAWGDLNENQPRAFLNYLLFDNDFQLQKDENNEGGFDFAQVSSAAEINGVSPHERLSLENITIKKEGFIYIYVSNQSEQNMEVYFDDLRVKHTYSDIVGGADFYPFGLTINDRQIQRELYRHGYQGKFAEKDEETGWNHFELREYDPVIGRWLAVDPMRVGASPYIGMGNNPVNSIDPTGGAPLDWYTNNKTGELKWINGNAEVEGYTHLGEDLMFEFSSFIDRPSFDGMYGLKKFMDFSGEKLYSWVNLDFSQDKDGNLVGSPTITMGSEILKTFGLIEGSPYPGMPDITTSTVKGQSFSVNLEKHTMVNWFFEAPTFPLLGYNVVDVAQRLEISGQSGSIKYKASTDIFPSASLRINGTRVMKYWQPSFQKTHGLFSRPSPNLYQRTGNRDY